jgi:hypothetical protein
MPVAADLLVPLLSASDARREAALLTGLAAPDWDNLLAEAEQGGVQALLYQALRPQQGRLPVAAWDSLQRGYQSGVVVGMAQAREWEQLLRALSARGIDFLVLKGLPLAEELYGDPLLRPMRDLDVLIRRDQLELTQAVLAERGYRPFVGELFPGANADFESEVTLVRDDAASGFSYYCEPHWHLVDSPYYQHRLALDWFWGTARPARVRSVDVRVLGREGLLLYLCAHLALHHRDARLIWLCDVDRLLRREGASLDWETILERAQAFELVLSLRTVLDQVCSTFDSPLPFDVGSRLAAMEPGPEERRIFAGLGADQPDGEARARFLRHLREMPGMREKWRYLFANVFPDRAYMQRRYAIQPGWLLPFFYLVRLAEGLRAACRLLLALG